MTFLHFRVKNDAYALGFFLVTSSEIAYLFDYDVLPIHNVLPTWFNRANNGWEQVTHRSGYKSYISLRHSSVRLMKMLFEECTDLREEKVLSFSLVDEDLFYSVSSSNDRRYIIVSDAVFHKARSVNHPLQSDDLKCSHAWIMSRMLAEWPITEAFWLCQKFCSE